jgi:hypothetical protein
MLEGTTIIWPIEEYIACALQCVADRCFFLGGGSIFQNKCFLNEVEYVGKRQIVKIEQLETKQDNNNLKHIFVAYILGRKVLENSSGRTV